MRGSWVRFPVPAPERKMNRFDIALGKSPPPPPEPSFYFMGIDKGEIRTSIHIVIGHLEKGEGPNPVFLFVVDSAESVSPALQELNKYSTTTLLDFVKFTHKPMKARINCRNKFIDEILLLHKIPCEQGNGCNTPEWRNALFQGCPNFLSIREKDRKYGLVTSEFQRAFELALSLALDSIHISHSRYPFNDQSAENWLDKGPF